MCTLLAGLHETDAITTLLCLSSSIAALAREKCERASERASEREREREKKKKKKETSCHEI